MDLRRSHDRSLGFDAFLVGVACFGLWVAWFGFSRGGAWSVLAISALIGEALLVYGIFIEPQRIVVTRHRIALTKQSTTWIRIVFLSDLHAGAFRSSSWYERISRESAALQPDLVLLGGDYVLDRAEPVSDLAALSDIPARLGKYFVLGNHDLVDRPQDIRRALVSFGYEDLTNRSVRIGNQDRELEVQGMDDCWHGKPKRFQRASPDIPHVTVSHEPDALMDVVEGQTDLVFVGHTHGGQVRFPALGALWPIPAKLGRAVDRGRKIIHGVPCVISNGLGETDGRMRLFSPPEIVVVEAGIS